MLLGEEAKLTNSTSEGSLLLCLHQLTTRFVSSGLAAVVRPVIFCANLLPSENSSRTIFTMYSAWILFLGKDQRFGHFSAAGEALCEQLVDFDAGTLSWLLRKKRVGALGRVDYGVIRAGESDCSVNKVGHVILFTA